MPKAKTRPATAIIYAVVGSDEAEVKRAAAELATKLTPPEAGDFGQEVIDGAVDNAEQAAARIRSTIEALQTLPFLGGAKLVWLKNANFLGDNVIGRAGSVQATLEELAEVIGGDLGADVTSLLIAPAARDLERALTLVRRLLDQGESAIGILLVAVLPTIRNLLLAKDLMERHCLARPHAPFQFISAINRLPTDATEHLPRKKDGSINGYALGLASKQ